MIIKYCHIEYLVYNEIDLKRIFKSLSIITIILNLLTLFSIKDCINFLIYVIHMLNVIGGLIFYQRFMRYQVFLKAINEIFAEKI